MTVLGSYVFSLKKKKNSINCFLQTCMAQSIPVHSRHNSRVLYRN